MALVLEHGVPHECWFDGVTSGRIKEAADASVVPHQRSSTLEAFPNVCMLGEAVD
jgi:hypothetical protein